MTFSSSSLSPQFITVQTTTDSTYTGDRRRTLTLTAAGYPSTSVTVNIRENTPQPITLEGVPTELSLVRFTSTMIGVSVDIAADLTVKAEGAVRLAGDSTLVRTNLGEMGSTQIEILGTSEGKGTVSFTVSGARKATARAVVRVMVSTPTLVITEVSPPTIKLLTRETTVVTVSVSAIGNHDSTLKATVTGTGNNVTPTEMTDVVAGTATTFTVTAGLAAGDETLTLTASHPDYESANAVVDVRVVLRPLELSVEPSPLEVVIDKSAELTIEVSATEGATLTVTIDRDGIIKELADEYLLMSGETRTEISVRGDNIGDTTLTIEAEAEGYTSSTTTVSIEVLDLLRIEADTDRLSLVEGGANAELSVNLNRIDAGRGSVTVMIEPEGSGLTVSESSLTFNSSSLGPQFITVDTTTDSTYTGDRSATLTLTADDYATTMVIVTILENTPQPIELKVVGSTELSLVRFTSTMIKVNVKVAAEMTIKAEGAVRSAKNRISFSSNLGGKDPLETEIEISGVSEGQGTVSFTVSGARKATATAVVSVTVTRPKLVISEISPSTINLLTRETTVVTVSVSAIGNHSSTLTAMVSGIGNSVTPTEIIGVRAGTPTTFTVTAGLAAGDETLTLTASYPDYDSASTEVDVRVDLRPLELSVEPSPLEVVIGTSKVLTIDVSATEGVTLTVTVDRDDRIRELADEYLLMNGETSITIEVRGNAIGDTILTIEAEAEGYTSATTTVSIEVLDSLRIEAEPATFELAEDASTQISVSLNRIDAARDTVTVMIEPEGSGLTVRESSLTFSRSSLGRQSITVDTTTDSTYTGDRRRILTLTARDYTTTMVIVTILENTPQSIGLEVKGPTELGLVIFTSTVIEVNVDVDATLNVETSGAMKLANGSTSASFILSAGATQIIWIERSSNDEGSVTFALSEVKEAVVTTAVKVTVSTPRLVITEVSPPNINLLIRETTVVTVRVNAVGNPNSTLTAMVTGTGNSVTPTEIIGVAAGMATTFTVTAGLDAGDETLTLTASHPDYDLASTKVDVRVDLPRVGLSVEPSLLKVVTEMNTILTIEVQTTATIKLSTDDPEIARVGPEAPFILGQRSSTEISIRGGNIGDTTLTITVKADGYTTETRFVNVMVLDSLRIEADTDRLSLMEGGDGTELRVGLNRIDADRDTVTVMIKPEGSGLTVSRIIIDVQ